MRVPGSFLRSFAFVLFVCVLVAPPPGRAQGEGTVTIGNETKKTAGVIVAMNNGDVACYLKLKDDRGGAFEEMAKFEICEKAALVGKRVALAYELGRVMADECGGDTNCKKTRTVALVNAVRIIDSKAGAQLASFCKPTETTVFACQTGAKLVSVCASRDAAPGTGTLQYRFGKPDPAEPLELVLPETALAPSRVATGENMPFPGGGGAWLRFAKGPMAYTVYSGIGNWGPKGEKRTKEGVVVERGGKPIANLKCTGKPLGLLGPDWLDKVGIKSGNQDFEFPD